MVEHKNIIVSKRLVVINSASSVIARLINFAVLMWVYQYLLKRLPAEEFAVLPVVTSLMVFAPLFFSFFIGGISRYTIDAYAKGDFTEARRILSSLFPVLLLAAAVFLPAGLLLAANIEKVLNIAPQMVGDARIMLTLLLVCFTYEMTVVPYKVAYAVRQRYLELNLLEVMRDLIRAVLVVVFLLTINSAVIWVVVATFIAEMVLVTVTLVRSRKLVPELYFDRHLFSFSRAREMINFGVWTTLGRLGSIMYTNAATIVLNLHGTAVDVTSYHIGATFFRQLQSTINLAAQPLQPAITAMNALADKRRLASTVLRGGRYALWVSMILAAPLIVYADAFIHLYLGDNYSKASMIIVLFMVMFPFTQPTILLPITATAMARVRAFFLPAFLFQFGGLGLMLIFVTWLGMGAIGVTLALTIITIGSQLGYFWWFSLRLTETSFATFATEVLWRGLLPAGVGTVVWVGLRLIAAPDTWVRLIGFGAAGALVYVIVLLMFCLNSSERADLRRVLGRFGI